MGEWMGALLPHCTPRQALEFTYRLVPGRAPSVVEGSDYALHICGGNSSRRWSFSSEAGVFWVTLVQTLERE